MPALFLFNCDQTRQERATASAQDSTAVLRASIITIQKGHPPGGAGNALYCLNKNFHEHSARRYCSLLAHELCASAKQCLAGKEGLGHVSRIRLESLEINFKSVGRPCDELLVHLIHRNVLQDEF